MNFAITSQGRTGSYWLAAALDRHPEITCAHSKQIPPVPNYQGKAEEKSLQGTVSEADIIPHGPAEFYSWLGKFGEGPNFGTVHTFDAGEHAQLVAAGVPCAHLTRHPITRLSSFADRGTIEMSQSDYVKTRITDTVDACLKHTRYSEHLFDSIEESKASVSAENWLPFVSGCFDLAHEAQHIGGFDVVAPFERLTSDPNYFSWFFKKITGINPGFDYVDAVFSAGKLNALTGLRDNALFVFENWPTWKKDLFLAFDDLYHFHESFSAFGYDIHGAIGSARSESQWVNRTREIALQMNDQDVLLENLGKFRPAKIVAGTIVNLFVRTKTAHLQVTFGDQINNTGLLHSPLPYNVECARVSFRAPASIGHAKLKIESYNHEADNPKTLFENSLEIVGPGMRLAETGFLRMEISPLEDIGSVPVV